MAKIADIDVNVGVKIRPEKADAFRALKIVEWYLNGTDDSIVTHHLSDGSIFLSFNSLEVDK